MTIDARANRFRPLGSTTNSAGFPRRNVGLVSLPSQRLHDYALMNHKDAPSGICRTFVRGLTDQHSAIAPEYRRRESRTWARSGPVRHHPKDPLTLADYNARAATFRPGADGRPLPVPVR